MKYEIPREMFKQRLEDRLNFVFIDLAGDKTPVTFKDIEPMATQQTLRMLLLVSILIKIKT